LKQTFEMDKNPRNIHQTPSEQLSLMDLNFSLERDTTYYLISDKWWTKFKRYGRYADDVDEDLNPGPVDNSTILEPPDYKELRKDLIDWIHYNIVTEAQWNLLVKWFEFSINFTIIIY